jgi:hypothetical protein
MKKGIATLMLIVTLIFPKTARTDLFGGDLILLSQILLQAIGQLTQLRSILGISQDSLGLIQSINAGINDSLRLLSTMSNNRDPGIYNTWKHPDLALAFLENIYGRVANSKDSQAQRDTDRSIAEAITRNNAIFEYTLPIDQMGEQIKAASHTASPGGAQKLTAEALGVVVNLMNESLRTQATGIKLQAQNLAIENKKDKDATRQMLADAEGLRSAMQSDRADFSIPRF